MNGIEEYKNALLMTLEKGEMEGYKGYSKFDGLHGVLTKALSFGWWPLRLIWTQIVMRSPVNIRPHLLIQKGVNPEAPALFARANLDCASANLQGAFLERARSCLNWLLDNDSSQQSNYHGRCWGYHHPWQSPGFYQPPGYPNAYITTISAGALVHGYQQLSDQAYLMAARSACEFLLTDLPVLYEDKWQKCIAYVPDMRIRMQVININALAGAVLAQVGVVVNEKELLSQAEKLMAFVANQQTSYGAWNYTTDIHQSLVAHDNYHTGMILDALLSYENSTGDLRFRNTYLKGLDFYRNRLFMQDGAPRWSNFQNLPFDVHGSAQGILTFSEAGDFSQAQKVANWALRNFYYGDGNFRYQIHGMYKKNFTLMHWCNGWMARGLGALLLSYTKSNLN